MPSGVRESDSAIIKRSLASVDTKLSAQNDEICALKLQLSELTALVTLLVEGKNKCDKCSDDKCDEIRHASSSDESDFASANEKEDTLTAPGVTETQPKQTRKQKNDSTKVNKGQNSNQMNANRSSTPKKSRTRKSKRKSTTDNMHTAPLVPPLRAGSESHNKNNHNKEEWQTAGSRKRRNYLNYRNKQVVRGCGAPSDLLCAADNVKYLHVWGARPDTTEANVISYLNAKKSSTNYTVVKMTSKRSADYASFKVGVPENDYEECVKPQFWPKGFKAERWLFRLERPASAET
ncbi:hypothetical protein O0L34_g4246 [Tuta absoluta]|nr:hypothetical protein O0L34_g17803 [Tuta absoluta]KAJ2951983.1 hypothetical protein O0L34_g4246 [Tuta absoluta]